MRSRFSQGFVYFFSRVCKVSYGSFLLVCAHTRGSDFLWSDGLGPLSICFLLELLGEVAEADVTGPESSCWGRWRGRYLLLGYDTPMSWLFPVHPLWARAELGISAIGKVVATT